MTGALSVKSGVDLVAGGGVTLLGSQEDSDYPSVFTRVAGIEIRWPTALINVNDQRGVRLSGGGTIDGRGKKWWDKYWSPRRNGYEPRGRRFESAKTRGGYASEVLVRDTRTEGVPPPFTFTLNRNPGYPYATIPAEVGNPPAHRVVMNTPVLPAERGYCEFRNIRVENVEIVGARRVFSATGLPEKPIVGVTFSNVTASAEEAGFIEHARGWKMRDVRLTTARGEPVKMTDAAGVESPQVFRR